MTSYPKMKKWACILKSQECSETRSSLKPLKCTYHVWIETALIEKRVELPHQFMEDNPNNLPKNRGICLFAKLPFSSECENKIVFKKNEVIIPVGEYVLQRFEYERQGVTSAVVDDLMQKMDFHMNKQNYLLYSNVLSKVSDAAAKKSKYEKDCEITVNQSKITVRDSFKYSKPLLSSPTENMMTHLHSNENSLVPYEKPWNEKHTLPSNLDINTCKQSTKIQMFQNSLKYSLSAYTFPNVNVDGVLTYQQNIQLQTIRAYNKQFNEYKTFEIKLSSLLERPLLNQYSKSLQRYVPVFSVLLSGQFLVILSLLGYPLSNTVEEKTKDYMFDKNNKEALSIADDYVKWRYPTP